MCPWLLQDCYILDHSGTKIYVWKGRGATKAEKQMAMSKALVGATDAQRRLKNVVTLQLCSESHMYVTAKNTAVTYMDLKSGKVGFKSRFNAIPWGCCED